MITLKNIDVIFGDRPEQVFPLIDQGYNREQIQQTTGLITGVQQANLTIKKGEICVLMGLSGSGKSTLLRCLNGLNTISRGEILIDYQQQSINFSEASEALKREIRMHHIAMVFQSFALMPWLTVAENVAFGLDLQKISKKEKIKRISQQLSLVGLTEWKNAFPHELSGGMRQRVGLARALASESPVLLMDEPFSALDPLIRHQLQEELLSLQEELQKTIVFVSHDLDEALKLGTQIAIMKDGCIVQHGSPEEIILHPANDYVRSFVSNTNPLGVLKANTLMKQYEVSEKEAVPINNGHYSQLIVNGDKLQQAYITQEGKKLDLQHWQPGHSIQQLKSLPTTIPLDTPMQDIIAIKNATRQNIFVVGADKIIGYITESELYHGFLGKHLAPA
ncbi:choline ABC transporter ATP-binding protein [Zooshikella ganghwensis]|uniref:choline ABC transporter ATP-binding protein n=1 Tax=Zooshikella ganghwensis TaxID=202772 RepID=UPI00042121F7|nr:choline ABC transporter ATP-binding protein [Zooshikella ganghwensis]